MLFCFFQESKKAEAALSIMKEQYEAQLSEFRQKILTLQMVSVCFMTVNKFSL